MSSRNLRKGDRVRIRKDTEDWLPPEYAGKEAIVGDLIRTDRNGFGIYWVINGTDERIGDASAATRRRGGVPAMGEC